MLYNYFKLIYWQGIKMKIGIIVAIETDSIFEYYTEWVAPYHMSTRAEFYEPIKPAKDTVSQY